MLYWNYPVSIYIKISWETIILLIRRLLNCFGMKVNNFANIRIMLFHSTDIYFYLFLALYKSPMPMNMIVGNQINKNLWLLVQLLPVRNQVSRGLRRVLPHLIIYNQIQEFKITMCFYPFINSVFALTKIQSKFYKFIKFLYFSISYQLKLNIILPSLNVVEYDLKFFFYNNSNVALKNNLISWFFIKIGGNL